MHASLGSDKIPAQAEKDDCIVNGGLVGREWSASRPGHRRKWG